METPEHPKNPMFPQSPLGETYPTRKNQGSTESPHQSEQHEWQADIFGKR